jgi:citrate lyase beta subunit
MRRTFALTLAMVLATACSSTPEAAEVEAAPDDEPAATAIESSEPAPSETDTEVPNEQLDALRAAKVNLSRAAVEFGYMNLAATMGGAEDGCPDELAATLDHLGEIGDLPSAELRVAVSDMESAARMMGIACFDGYPDDLKDEWDAAYHVAEVELERLIIDAGG